MVDRTAEFFSTVDILRGSTPKRHVVPTRRTGGADARVKVAAKEIAKSLNMTAQLVGQLKGLVQRRSLFNDHAHSINENAAAVKKNISHLRAQLSALVKLVASRGGTEGSRAHWIQVSELLKLRLMACTKGLQDALQTRAKNIKYIERHKSQFNRSNWAPLVQLNTPMFASTRKQATPPGAQAGNGNGGHHGSQPRAATPPQPASNGSAGSQLSAPGASQHRRRGMQMAKPPAVERRGVGGPGVGLRHRQSAAADTPTLAPSYMTPGSFQQQSQIAAQRVARNRTQEALQVESSIVELGHMFSKMTHMVADQAAQVEQIAENMDVAESYVQQGQTELLKWLQDVSRHRSLILKTFAILIAFILLFAWMNKR